MVFLVNKRLFSIRIYLLLALVSAMSLSITGCEKHEMSSAKQEEAPTQEQTMSNLLKKADAQDAESQFKLWRIYNNGEGVAQDKIKGLDWLQKSASQGYAVALLWLGKSFLWGEQVPKDPTQAVELFKKAADQGNAQAQYALGSQYEKGEGATIDLAKATELFQKAATQGDADAQFRLGQMHASGEGVQRDAAKAVEFFEKAAKQGNSTHQLLLALNYQFGNGGIPKDAFKAAEWFGKAAAQGKASAQNQLGKMYYAGEGISKDVVIAYAWLNLAASGGVESAVQGRNVLDLELSTTEKAEAQRLSSGWKQGDTLVREVKPLISNANVPISPRSLSKQITGTAFVVSKLGHAITNYHVVKGCTEVRIEGRNGVVKVKTSDTVNDLALLQLPFAVDASAVISADQSKLRQGDDVAVFGFPLNSVLSSGGNFTPGVVSALTGLGNNTNQIQITAAIQPGSSGSPVLNKKGEVVGVASLQLSDTKMVKATGQVGQNVNFAVSGQTLKSFLGANMIDYSTGGFISFEKSSANLAEEAKRWTTVVECWN